MSIDHSELNRRTFAIAMAFAPATWAAKPTELKGSQWYTPETAPDKTAKEILSSWLPSLEHGTPKGISVSQALQGNFPQIIEQNLARMNPRRMRGWLASMGNIELQALAEAYLGAIASSSHTARIYNIFASRLDADALGALSYHFGFSELYSAIVNVSPEKAYSFQLLSNVNLRPSTGAVRRASSPLGPVVSVDMTIRNIYLEFRTAPIGSLSIAGSLYETTAYAIPRLSTAFGAGYALGTVLAHAIQYFSPSLWDSIGENIYNVVEWISSAVTPTARGVQLERSAGLFNLDALSYSGLGYYGGDYGVTRDWSINNGDGGGPCSRLYSVTCNYF